MTDKKCGNCKWFGPFKSKPGMGLCKHPILNLDLSNLPISLTMKIDPPFSTYDQLKYCPTWENRDDQENMWNL